MLIFLLFVILLVFSIFIFFVYKKDVLEPSLIFSVSFLALSFMACLNARKWQLGLHLNTFLVILLGVIEFFCVGYIIKKLLFKKSVCVEKSLKLIETNKYFEFIYLFFIIVFDSIFLYFLISVVGNSFDDLSSVIESISKYNNLVKFSDRFNTVKLPFLISNGRIFIVASGYWFLYVIINNYISKKKIQIPKILIVIFSIISSMLTGSRTEAFFLVISGIVFYLCLLNKKNGFAANFNMKTIKNVGIVIIFMIVLFIPMANLLGRKTNKSPFDYISIYCGAQVKNLDIFLQNKDTIVKNKIWGSQTFRSLIISYGEKIGFKGYKPYRLDLPFQKVNNHDLGNVYTTFYPYIYDFGYFGMFIMIFIMSTISHSVYEYIKRRKLNKKCSLLILTYGIIVSALALSFFSNKFFEHLFTISFIKYLITWILLNYVFCNFHFKKRDGKNG